MSLLSWSIPSNLLIASLIGCVAWLVLRVARRPAVAHALFLLAILKITLPSVVEMPILAAPIVEAPRVEFVSESQGATGDTSPHTVVAHVARVSLPEVPAFAAGVSKAQTPWTALSWCYLIWALGGMGTAVRLWQRTRAFARATIAVQAAPSWLSAGLRELMPCFGLKRAPRICIVDADIPPAVIAGFGVPRILFPARLLTDLSALQVKTLVAHELAHIRRGDHWVRVFEVVMTVLWWWLPLLWLLRAGLRQAEELCCDAWVAAVLPDARHPYCSALLRVAASNSPLPMPALASPVRRLRDWKTRLEDIMCHHVPPRSSMLVRFAMMAFALVLLPLAIAQSKTASSAIDLQASLQREVEVVIDSAELLEWTGWLTRETGIPFDVMPSAREIGARTTLRNLRLPKMPAARALDVISVVAGMSWSANAERVVLEARGQQAPRCSFFGSLRTTGSVTLQKEDTLLSGLFRAGLTEGGDLSRVVLIRKDQLQGLVIEVDLGKMLRTGETTANVLLQDGDVVFVPRLTGQVSAGELPPLRLEIGARLRFVLYGNAASMAGGEQLSLLEAPQVVGRDGKIFVPYVGHVEMVGKTKDEVAKAVSDLYRSVFHTEVRLDVMFL